MKNIDKQRRFIPLNICILTISDTRNKQNDKSGNLLFKKIISSFLRYLGCYLGTCKFCNDMKEASEYLETIQIKA